MGDHESFTSLGQVYEQHCVTENKDIEYPLTVYQNEMAKMNDGSASKESVQLDALI